MRKIFKLPLIVLMALLIALLASLMTWIITWKSACPNFSGDVHTCRHSDDRKLHLKLGTQQRKYFDIYLAENSKPYCRNPYFPSIHIKTNETHNAWVHIVYTDSKAPQWRTFIDAANQGNQGSAYPFYTYEQDFYDEPLWYYSLLSKPLSFWKGHAFAVKVDHENKTIKCIGGIEWGFELSWVKLRPQAIHPKLLDEHAWEQAWQVLQEKFPGYKQTYEGSYKVFNNSTI